MTLGIEREGLAEPLRELVASGTPTLGTCAGLIMLGRDHLGLLDVGVKRNAFGRQLASFETDLDIPALGGDGPLRAVFIRAPWLDDVPDGVEVLAEVDGHPVAIRQEPRTRGRFPPRADRRHEGPRLARRTDPRPSRAKGTRMRDQRADALAQILVQYSTRVQKGDVCVIQATSTIAEPLIDAVYARGAARRRPPAPPARRPRPRCRRSSSSPPTSSSTSSRPLARWAAEESDVRIVLMADENTRALSTVRRRRSRRAPRRRASR